MRIFRHVALGTVLALLASLFSMGTATAATTGVGTSTAGSTIAQLDLADLLSARVLGDDSRSSIDKALGTPEAATVLRPLTLASGTVAALNKEIAPVEARSQGAQQNTDYSADLGSLGLTQIVDGTLTPASLAAVVDGLGARSGLVDSLADLVVGGGLLTVDGVDVNLGTDAAKETSNGARTVDVGTITGLNLGTLLGALGIPVDGLGVGTVNSLVDELGLLGAGNPVADLLTTLGIAGAVPTDAAGMNALVNGLQADITAATGAITSLTGLGVACGAVDLSTLFATVPTLSAQLTELGIPGTDDCNTTLAALPGLVAGDQADLGGLLSGLLQLVDGINLLTIDGINAGVVAKATDAVNTSVAQVTATIGDINIANLATIPGLDALATAQQVTDAVTAATDQLGGILGAVSPDLADLIDLNLLDTSGTGVSKANNGYVRSVAKLTALDLSINPPDTLDDIIAGLPVSGIGDVLTAIPGFGTLPALPGLDAADALNSVLSATQTPVAALASGADFAVVSVDGTSEFLPASAPAGPAPTGGTLPRTGASTTAFALIAALMAVLGLAIRRHVLVPVRSE